MSTIIQVAKNLDAANLAAVIFLAAALFGAQ